MSYKSLEDLNNLYTDISSDTDTEVDQIAEEIFATIAVSMASEGYTARAIESFIKQSTEHQILEYYLNCEVLEDLVSEEYIVEQLTTLEEGIGAGLRILGKALMPGIKAVGQGLKTAGRTVSVATKRAVGPGVRSGVTKLKNIVTSPAGKIGLGAAALGGAYGLGRMQGSPVTVSKTPPVAPGAAPGPSTPAKPSATAPKVKTPSKADINKEYDKLKKKDPAAAEKYGLEQWKKMYPKLAAKLNPDGTQKGSGQSEMEKQAAELKKIQPSKPEESGPQAKSELPGGDYSVAATKEMSKRTKNILGIKDVKEGYDAYDLVLEYLLSEGHADTVSEANYVMMQMSSDHIQSIVEMGVMPEPINPDAHKEAQRLARQQGRVRALEAGAATPGEKEAAKGKLRGPQLPGV